VNYLRTMWRRRGALHGAVGLEVMKGWHQEPHFKAVGREMGDGEEGALGAARPLAD
jgi:hypothetical protein